MTTVNFFWKGSNFRFLEMIVILSHIKVGHKPIIWLDGKYPKGKYWENIENKIELNQANQIFDTNEFLSRGGNVRTAADLWRFHFLYDRGGLYCDTDAFALTKFPKDDWIVCSAQNNKEFLSIGVIKAPKEQKLFSDAIKNIKKDWGNVKVFTDSYKKYFGHTNPTHESLLFYPYRWQECEKLLKPNPIPKGYSVHFYTKALEDHLIQKSKKFSLFRNSLLLSDLNEEWCSKNQKSLLNQLQLLLKTKN